MACVVQFTWSNAKLPRTAQCNWDRNGHLRQGNEDRIG